MLNRVILAAVFVGGMSAAAGDATATATDTTKQQRLEAIRHARVWSATNVRTIDLKRGPQGPFAFPPGETVTCDFAPKEHGKGTTRKFECVLPSGRELKVYECPWCRGWHLSSR